MKKLSIKKLSFLGLILMVASAVTAAILPKDNSQPSDKFQMPSATASENQGITCELSNDTVAQPCDITAASGTTGDLENPSSDGAGNTTGY